MTDIQRTLLGDHEAAKRLTEKGVLVPCPFCGGVPIMRNLVGGLYSVKCYRCDAQISGSFITKEYAISVWNTRAPILSAEEMEMLEGME